MSWFKRGALLLIVNVFVVLTISLILNLLGVQPYLYRQGIDYGQLLIFCFVWGMGGAFISLLMSRMIAKWSMGVRVINPETMDSGERRLVEMVYDLSRKAGLKRMPEVGFYESPEVNAFATGPTKSRSLVAVSSGLLQRMDRSEVEGVIGHEVAHIANGDMVTMTLVQGVINAFVMFFARIIAFALANALRSSNDDRPNHGIQMIVTFVLEIAFSFLGMLVVAAFSRYREYRADRGGAKLAGKEKMIGALQALQRTYGLVEDDNRAIAAFKISGRSNFAKLFSTHPPLEERIARLKESVVS